MHLLYFFGLLLDKPLVLYNLSADKFDAAEVAIVGEDGFRSFDLASRCAVVHFDITVFRVVFAGLADGFALVVDHPK